MLHVFGSVLRAFWWCCWRHSHACHHEHNPHQTTGSSNPATPPPPLKKPHHSRDSSSASPDATGSPITRSPRWRAAATSAAAAALITCTTYSGAPTNAASRSARAVASASRGAGRESAWPSGPVIPAAKTRRWPSATASPFSAWTCCDDDDEEEEERFCFGCGCGGQSVVVCRWMAPSAVDVRAHRKGSPAGSPEPVQNSPVRSPAAARRGRGSAQSP